MLGRVASLMDAYTWLWLAWAFAFFAIELPAWLDGKPGGTLSEHIWTSFSVRGKGRFWRVRRGLLALALTMLLYHFLAGGGWLLFD